METCKYKVGQIWRTRHGRDVAIARIRDLTEQYPIVGRMDDETFERSWTKDGKFAAGADEIPRGGDLVELLKDVPAAVDIQAQIGTSWKTRDGRLAVIRGVFHSSLRPLQGVITGVATGVSWMHDGRFKIGGEHAYDLIERIESMPDCVTNTPRPGDAPGSRDRAGPPTPRSEPVGLKESIGRLATKGTGVVTVENAYETYEDVKAWFEFKAEPTPIKWPKLPDAAVFGDVDGVLPDGTVKVKLGGNVEQESIADEAKRIVAGVRRKQYGGTPERSFTAIADFWTALFKAKGRPEMVFTAEDVSPMMRLLKEARLCSSPDHRDSMVDIIGYTLTDAELRGIETPPTPEV